MLGQWGLQVYILHDDQLEVKMNEEKRTNAITLSVAKFFKDASLPLAQARPTFPPPFPTEGVVLAGVAAGLAELEEAFTLEDLGVEEAAGDDAASAAGVAAA